MFSAKATTTRADGVKVTQNVTIPVTIMNRTVVDTDFNPELEGSDWEFLYSDTSKSATTTDTYRSEHGEYFNIVFSTKAGEHPDQFIFENQFSYRGLEGLPSKYLTQSSGLRYIGQKISVKALVPACSY